eukprot:TRINITY_DN20417_c0_g1_i4.p2 TRINITY_DN20417_c0_g1~~TRINITY_DN20417_c0_g1_i4.p2  ORF type:complete len:235 (-),score=37.90 TRINITY_DN20417_c0_g1_i4:1519-2223(-)
MVISILRIVCMLSTTTEGRYRLKNIKFSVALLDSIVRSSSCQKIVDVAKEALEHHSRASNSTICVETSYESLKRRVRSMKRSLTIKNYSTASVQMLTQSARQLNQSSQENELQAYYMKSIPVMMRMLKRITSKGSKSVTSLSQIVENQENLSPGANVLPVSPEVRKQQRQTFKEMRVKAILKLLQNMLSDPLVVKEVRSLGGMEVIHKIAQQNQGDLRTLANQVFQMINDEEED